MEDLDVSQRYTFAWSSHPRVRSFAPVVDVAGLDVVLQRVREASAGVGMPLQVEIWSGDWSGNEPLPEPFVQAVVGHPERGALIWTERGEVEVGVDPVLEPWSAMVCYEGSARAQELDGEWTRLTPDAVRKALAEWVATGHRPTFLAWVDPFTDGQSHTTAG